MFWTKYVYICEERDLKPYAVLKELGISSGSAQSWKKGAAPNGDILSKIAEYFDVSIEYLIKDNEEISITSEKKKSKMLFKTLKAIPQRWASLRRGHDVSEELMMKIIRFVNCSIRFINNEEIIEFSPKDEYNPDTLNDTDTLFSIFEILDCCADSDDYRALQIQLSRIVLYNIGRKGFTKDMVLGYTELDPKKMNFIYTGEKNRDVTLNYGINFSDLTMIKKKTGLSYQYMFTGIENND